MHKVIETAANTPVTVGMVAEFALIGLGALAVFGIACWVLSIFADAWRH